MFAYTDTRESPWYVVEADDKRTMRLNLISHLLTLIPYEDVPRRRSSCRAGRPAPTSARPSATRTTSPSATPSTAVAAAGASRPWPRACGPARAGPATLADFPA